MSITIETHHRIEPLEAEWDQLAERCSGSPFVRPGWICAWQRCFGGAPLSLICARRGPELVGLVPVVTGRLAVRSPTNWHTPSFEPLAIDEAARASLIEALLAPRPHRIDLSFVDPGGAGVEQCLRTGRSSGFQTVLRVIQRSPYIEIDADWESFEAQIPSRRRSKMRRFRRRLEEQGSLSVELEHGDRGLEALLDEGFAIEGSGWKGERGTAIISSPETERFYREVAAWASERGWLRLWFLRLDGRAIAFGFCLEQGGAHYELKVGFDPAHASFGPGVILTQARLEHSFSAGLGSYEFLGQPERHKLDWTETCRELARLQLFAPTLAGHGSRLAWTHGRRLALEAIQRGRAVGERAKQVRSQE